MSLSPGDKLGPYEIVEPIGRGGMGEVYRARDTRLGRDVAIKVSAQKFSTRFEREARVISSLNHPNICTLYDVGDNYLVMELVEGQTLSERIKQGAIPLGESLAIAKQIAGALEAAHEKGITHRDLKPGNVMVKEDGSVKVLDFGLAKQGSAGAPGAADDPDLSPTLSMTATEAGAVLGTAAYMAPEQARGKVVDKRADIWAFGVVLYEMVIGRKPFMGEDLSETLAAVLKDHPDFSAVPPQLRYLLGKCLEKDSRKRLRDISGAELLMDAGELEAQQAGSHSTASLARWLWPAIAVVSIAAAVGIANVHFNESPPTPEVVKFRLEGLGDVSSFANYFALSPDGQQLAYTSSEPDGTNRIWIRSLGKLEPHILPGTEEAYSPFWSPDSRKIGFAVGSRLKTVAASGVADPTTLTTIEEGASVGSGTWNRDDVILFGTRQDNKGIRKISADGGPATTLTQVDGVGGETTHYSPVFLPDGRHFLYLRSAWPAVNESDGIYIASIDGSPEDPPSERLLASAYPALYAPSKLSSEDAPKGLVLFWREGTLLAQPFDPDALTATGDAVPVATNIGTNTLYANFSVSADGALAYRTSGGSGGQLVWRDRQGNLLGQVGEVGPWREVSLSPDGDRVVTSRMDGQVDLWMTDLDRGAGTTTRFTYDANLDSHPVWSPLEDPEIVYSGGASRTLIRRAANGAGEPETLLPSPDAPVVYPQDFLPDGSALLYAARRANLDNDLLILPLEEDGTGTPTGIPFLATPAFEGQGQFSPNGRWVAYVTNETGDFEVVVRPFMMPEESDSDIPPGRKWQISIGGGSQPRWNPNGEELLYLSREGQMMSVAIDTGSPELDPQGPEPLFETDIVDARTLGQLWDISPDGEQFLINANAGDETSGGITVVLNWEEDLDR